MTTSKVVTKLLLVLLGTLGATRARSVTTYDQRQEGKVNVQIDVKDVQILALVDSEMLDDYTNYDYAYDYADFTIKPSSRPTTGKPPSTAGDASSTSSSNEEAWSTWPTNPSSSASTSSTPESTSPSSDESTKAPEVSSTVSADESLPATIAVALVHQNPSEDESKKIVEGVSNASKLEAEKQEQIQSELSTSTTTVAATVVDETKPDGSKRPAGIAEPRKRCPVGFLLKSGKCFKRRPRLALMKLAPALLSKSNILSGIPAAAAASATAPSS
ncbi:hypothetical protein TSAR_009599 [Trichomalopsis sarcophagae]|uniref:Folded gastrulation N-terminal domain-containing protein n=1 Tax=Trichomalopsis sarcophagae TaxID=543379 RepID=A0A232F2R9_9HYME|nr:hypothetical protein TSAR_009599 [Trichomalopsis sarcophagae]